MNKSVLVVNTPKNCRECTLKRRGVCSLNSTTYNAVHVCCPLRKLRECDMWHDGEDEDWTDGYECGWNDCLYSITGAEREYEEDEITRLHDSGEE